MTWDISRRGVLGAGASLLASSLLPRAVLADGGTPVPKRLVIVFSANGTIYDQWLPQGSGATFTLSPILTPLAPFQDRLLILDGVNVKSAGSGPGDDHMKGMGHMLTGIELLPGNTQGGAGTPAGFAGGISIDQRVVQDIGSNTRYPSLEFGVMVQNSDVWSRMIYAGANQPLPPMEDPVAAFARLFASSQMSSQAAATLLKRRQSVLDFAQASLGSLATRISSDDAVRVQQHQASVAAIEKQLIGQSASCMPPTVQMQSLTDINNYPAIAKVQTDLLVAA